MELFSRCPTCKAASRGTQVFVCRQCGKTFCDKCGGDHAGNVCVKCEREGTLAGKISKAVETRSADDAANEAVARR